MFTTHHPSDGHRLKCTEPRLGTWIQSGLLLALAVLIYAPTWSAPFFFDDLTYLVNNPAVRSPAGLAAIWRGTNIDYWPLSYSLFWAWWRLWGDQPLAFHLLNLAVHLGNTFLLVALLLRLKLRQPWLIAALFLCHPINVEAVAWIFQLKTTLAMALALLTACIFVDACRSRRNVLYGLSVVLFALSLLAKTSAVMLPVLFLLFVLQQRPELGLRRALAYVSPHAAVALVLGLIAVRFQAAAPEQPEWHGVVPHVLQIVTVFWFYLGKALWPAPLALFYPKWSLSGLMPWLAVGMTVAFGLMLVRWRVRPLAKRIFMASCTYALLLLPALGLVPLPFMRLAWVADHWQYLALPALLAVVVDAADRSLPLVWMRVAGIGGVAILSFMAAQRARVFASPLALWQEAVTTAPQLALAHYNLANLYLARGDLAATAAAYQAAIEADPSYALAEFGLGSVCYQRQDIAGATIHLKRALALNPALAEVHGNLALIYAQAGQLGAATAELHAALKIAPSWRRGHYHLGLILYSSGELRSAAKEFEQALQPEDDLHLGRVGLSNDFAQEAEARRYLAEIKHALEGATP